MKTQRRSSSEELRIGRRQIDDTGRPLLVFVFCLAVVVADVNTGRRAIKITMVFEVHRNIVLQV